MNFMNVFSAALDRAPFHEGRVLGTQGLSDGVSVIGPALDKLQFRCKNSSGNA